MRKWFTIPALLQLLITIGLIGFFLIQAGVSSSQLILKELQQQMLKQVSEQLSQRMQTAMHLNQMHYDLLQYGILNLQSTAERERYFVSHIKSYPDVAMTFIGLPDGSFYGTRRTADGEIQVVRNNSTTKGASWYYRIADTGEGVELVDQFPNFDPRKRPWYTKAAETGMPAFSSVYSHFVFREPTITASHPVYDGNNRLIGVFGVDYLLSWLGDTLGSLPIGASGQVFVTDSEGMLIATSFDSPSYKMVDGVSQLIPVKKSDSALIQASLALYEGENKNELPEFVIDGKKYFTGISNYQEYGVDWNIYVISAEDDFLGGVKKAVMQTVIILAASLLISVFVAAWIAGRVTKPIVELSKAAGELTKGNRVFIPEDGRKDELGILTRAFNEMGLQLTNVVARLEDEVAMRTLELKERNEELKQLSFSDSLTGLANRRQFDNAIESAWKSAVRHKRSVVLFMLDIDLFKDYNDTYGHQAGDKCLKAIGNLLNEKVRRSTDLAARYGGEEFVILLQEFEIDKIAGFAEEIRKSIEGLNIEHSCAACKNVTVSIGVAHMVPNRDTTPAMLVEMADRALYQAKENGRNLVVMGSYES